MRVKVRASLSRRAWGKLGGKGPGHWASHPMLQEKSEGVVLHNISLFSMLRRAGKKRKGLLRNDGKKAEAPMSLRVISLQYSSLMSA